MLATGRNETRREFWLVSDRTYNPSLQWRHNGHDGVSHHRCLDCLLNRLFRHRSKKISKLRVTDLCAGNPPVTGGFPSQRASNAENVSIWWRHHVTGWLQSPCTYLSLPPHRLRHRTLDKNPNGAFCGMEHLAHSTHCRLAFAPGSGDIHISCAQASDFWIERRQVVFLCGMQDSNPGSLEPNLQQTECPLTNQLGS